MIQEVRRRLYLPLRNLGEVCPLGKKPSHQPVVVLIGSLLPGGIRMAVVDLKPFPAIDRPGKQIIFQKLRPVVRGDAPKRFPKPAFAQPPLQPVKAVLFRMQIELGEG